jgi:hypothetical protein
LRQDSEVTSKGRNGSVALGGEGFEPDTEGTLGLLEIRGGGEKGSVGRKVAPLSLIRVYLGS